MTAPADSSLSLPTVLDDATRRFLRFARDRDPTALEMVLRDSSDRAYAHARRLLGNAADAEDAVQEAFLQLVKTSGRYDGSIPFAAWLARLVHVAAVRALRSRGRRTRRERLVSSTSSGSADPAVSDVHDVVRDAVKELPETFRAAIDLHYFSGLSQEDAVTALGVSANTLAVRIHRARERLRRTLRSRGFAATGAIIVSALASAPAQAATATVGATSSALVAAVSSGSALPMTPFPVSAWMKAGWSLQAHPLPWITAAAIAAGVVTLALSIAVDDPPAPLRDPPRPGAPLAWTGPAREVLPFIDPQAQMQVALDLDTLRTLGAHAKPTSLLGDPAVAVTIAHIRAQLEAARAQMGEVPPLFALMEQAHGAVLSARATQADGREGASIAAQLGPAGAAIRAYIAGLVGQWNLVPRSAGPFSGWVENERRQDIFVGLQGDLLLWATPNQVDESAARAQPRPLLPAAWTRSPSWLRADATLAMDHVRSLQKDGRDVLGVGAWLPRWQTDSPIIDAALSVEDGAWTTSLRISGVSRSGLRPIAASMRRLVTENPYAALAVGCDLADILNRDFAWKKLVPRLTGVSATELAEVLTGDVVAVATPGTPLPGLSVTVAIRPGTDAQQRMATVIARLVSAAHGEPTGPGRWIVSTPAGMLAIGIGPERVAVTTTAEGVDRWLALDAGTGISTEDSALTLQADLPALARRYLPLLYARMPAQRPFDLPIEREMARIVPGILAHSRAQDPTLTASRLLRSGEKPHHLDDVLRSKVPPEELDRALDRALSVFFDCGPSATPSVTPRSVTLLRLPDGIHEFNWPHVDWTTPLSPQAVARKIDGLRRILGPDPAELGMFPLPSYDIPRFDRTWLPDIEAVIRHLPRYSFTARTTSDGLAIEERGAPLAGAMSWMACYLSVILASPSVMAGAYHQHLDRLDGPGVKARHAAEVAVFERVKETIYDYQILQTFDLPTSPSLLMTGGRLTQADFAPFFQGRVPTADELDRLGTWTEGVNSFVESIWSVPLEPGWRLSINGHQRQVVVTSAPNPATEAGAVPKGDKGASDF